MPNTAKIVFLSPSDFELGDVGFKSGLYYVQQIEEGEEFVLVFTRIAGTGADFVPEPWLAEVTMWARDEPSLC